ncbi:hypothetical protein DVS28_a2436 [Euzebya pacifica]|jgi:uncharacterized protein (DUF305 family)|uniref:DUF305 domain-containing protein n=1 Tax=Euzebya pacifica TaxID=1608957 RepID=A0A346XY20_9ACTN|nr:hypothetical protein DVS28_a2436 [Euzebya pacifica]
MNAPSPAAQAADAAPLDRPAPRPTTLLLGLVLLAVVASTAYILGGAGTDVPGDSSPEAGFARDMTAHHSQAVEMAELLRPKTEDPEMQLLASDIALTQQAQIGQMTAWLDLWGLPAYSGQASMAWMGMAMDSTADMPGMASRAEIAALAGQNGETAELTFLRLMIEHHRAGVTMAEAVLERSDERVVTELAEVIAASQQYEIDTLQALIEQRTGAVDDAVKASSAEHMDQTEDTIEMDGHNDGD